MSINDPEVRYEYKDRKLTISFDRLIDYLNTEDRRAIMQSIVWDGPFLEWLLEFVIDGTTEDGGWPGRDFQANLLFKLRSRMDDLHRAAVETLSGLLASAVADRDRHRSHAWDLERKWPGDFGGAVDCPHCDGRVPIRKYPKFEYGCTFTKDEESLARDVVRRVREGRKIESLADLMRT